MTGLIVFGRTGQVARSLALIAPDATFLGRADADLSDPASCERAILDRGPAAVLNVAAYTAVDAAEGEAELAHTVNAAAPGAMGAACARLDIPLVHISTDYVFDGAGEGPRMPDDPVGPINAYGASKLAGERVIAATGARFAILRTSWVFSPFGRNFVTSMLRLGAERDRLTIVADQIGGPTEAGAIARAVLSITEAMRQAAAGGTFHFSGAPDVSWADFARAIFARTGREVDVADIPTSDYPTPARRPLNSRLDCRATEAAFGIARPDWRRGLDEVLNKLEAAT